MSLGINYVTHLLRENESRLRLPGAHCLYRALSDGYGLFTGFEIDEFDIAFLFAASQPRSFQAL